MRENEIKTTTKFLRKKPKPNQIRRKNEPIEQSTGMTCKKPKAQMKGKRAKGYQPRGPTTYLQLS